MKHKKILAALLAVSLVAAGSYQTVLAATNVTESNAVTAEIGESHLINSLICKEVGTDADGTIQLSIVHPSTGGQNAATITFPTEVDGQPARVVALEENCFAACTNLTEITIPEGVTVIPEGCFQRCSNLQTVTLPETLCSIEASAFDSCSALKEITLPDSLQRIETYAFLSCTALEKINLPDSLQNIAADAFLDTKLLDGQEDQEIQYLDHWAIQVGTLADDATSVTLEEGTVGIAEGLLEDRTMVTSISVPDSVKCIGAKAFRACSLTGELVLPKSLVYIGDEAFAFNDDIDAIAFPDTLESIGDMAFYKTSITTLTLPESVKIIGDTAFGYCKSLKTAELSGVITIGKSAFADNTALESVTLSDELESIGSSAFVNDAALNHVVIPDGVTKIESGLFSSCTSLDDVTIPDTIVSMDKTSFMNTAIWNNAEGVCYIGNWAVGASTNLTEIAIQDGTIGVADGAFSEEGYGGTKNFLEKATLPDGLLYIGASAFNYCQNMTGLSIPDTVKTIGQGAFNYCKGLTELTVPASVTEVGAEALNTMGTSITVLNPNLVIADDINTINATTIYAPANSTTQTYAKSYSKTFVATSTGNYEKGDPNNDGKIDVSDAVWTLTVYAKKAAGITVEETEEAINAADVDGDGSITVNDAVAILAYYAQAAAGQNPDWNTITGK